MKREFAPFVPKRETAASNSGLKEQRLGAPDFGQEVYEYHIQV
jgi:hypothetical protein